MLQAGGQPAWDVRSPGHACLHENDHRRLLHLAARDLQGHRLVLPLCIQSLGLGTDSQPLGDSLILPAA